jgi:hypothetical protein
MSWRTVGAVLPGQLSAARVELHFAAQLVSAAGTSLLTPDVDFSHTNLGWDSALDLLAGRRVGDASLRAALVFESLELAVLEGGLERASHPLIGSTMAQGLAWLGERIAGDPQRLSLPVHDMPDHPVAAGAPFAETAAAARTELAAWFANATAAIHAAVAEDRRASSVRCWPHHFDVASLITLDEGADAEEARSIGVGFSPGDGSYDQPYFYVTPWPYPPADALPALPGGAGWHTEVWTGAVLTAEAVISKPASRQAAVVQDALGSAVAASRALLRR